MAATVRLLPDRTIEVKSGRPLHDLACKTILPRKWDKKTQTWRFPLEAAPDLKSVFVGMYDVAFDEELESYIRKFTNHVLNKFKHPFTPALEEACKTVPLGHQQSWLGFGTPFKAVANLCEQGTGKSKMALDWCTAKGCNYVLFIVKNSNLIKWGEEIRKHSDYMPFVLRGTRHERVGRWKDSQVSRAAGRPTACVINYDYVANFWQVLATSGFDCIVLDESTAIKNTRTRRHKFVCDLGKKVARRLILTGTPLVNSPLDAFGQFKFLNPNIFGENFEAFRSQYVITGQSSWQILGYKNLEQMQEKIERHSFRVLKKDCLDLPPKVFEPYELEQPVNFEKGYKDLVDATILELGNKVIDNTLAITKINRCLQFCDGFLYTNSQEEQFVEHPTPKFLELCDFIEDHFAGNNRLIIWASFRATIRILERDLSKQFKNVEFASATGGMSIGRRSDLIRTFNDPIDRENKKRCLILQSAAMMHGIDVLCENAVYYSRTWSNEEWLQTQDRIHGINRGGESCTYSVFRISGTVEDAVEKVLQRKIALSQFILKDTESLAAFLRGEVRLAS